MSHNHLAIYILPDIFTVQTLKPGQLEEDYPITMFSENKRLSSS